MKEPTLNPNDILLLEQPLVKIPVDDLRTNLRTATRHLERDFQQASASAKQLSQRSAAGSLSQEEALKTVDQMLHRMRGLKRKLSDLNTNNATSLEAAKQRLDHLQTVHASPSLSSPEYQAWAKTRLARQMTDHLLRRGYLDSAKALARAEHIEPLVDAHLFEDCARIEASLRKGRVAEALAWCKENQSTLKKMKSTIEFELRFQEYIELIRAKKTNEAILYSRKHLAPWNGTHMKELKQAVVLLAFGPDTQCPPYMPFFEQHRWDALVISFRHTLLSMHALAPMSMLALSLHTGLAALKSPVCFSDETVGKNHNCPICASSLGQLAKSSSVPWAHHENSLIVCKLSGKIMSADEGREPMAFPKSGRVYAREALEKMALEKGGKVTCPISGETCRFTKLLKVYIS